MPESNDGARIYWVWQKAKPQDAEASDLSDASPSAATRCADRKQRPSVREALDLFLCQGFRMAYSSAPGMWAVLGRWLV
jgi:hypothetical protein